MDEFLSKVLKTLKSCKKSEKVILIIFSGLILSYLSLSFLFNIVQDYSTGGIPTFDLKIYNSYSGIRNKTMDTIFKTLTRTGNFSSIVIFLVPSVFYSFYKKKKADGIYLASNVLLVWVFNEILKHIFRRERPSFERLVEAVGYSFPSGHAMTSITLFILLVYFINLYLRKTRVRYVISFLLIIYGLSIGLSRTYVGVHYATDVIGGWIAGLIWSITAISIYKLTLKRND